MSDSINPKLLKRLVALSLPKGVDVAEYAKQRALYRPVRTRMSLAAVSGVLGLTGGVILLIFFAPLRASENVPLLLLACSIPAFLLTRLLVTSFGTKLPATEAQSGNAVIQRDGGLFYALTGLAGAWQRVGDKKLRQSGPIVVVYIFAGYTLLLTGAMLCLNQILDRGAATSYTATVQEKIVTQGKRHKNYFLRIPSPTAAWLPFLDFGGTEDISVNRGVYDRAAEGETTVTLAVHDGALGMPWYQWSPEAVGNLRAAVSAPSGRATLRADAPTITAACAWRDGFNLATEIGHAPAQDYRREYWPNGALKAEEPLIDGVIHGVGQYWFDNGARYANIPYRQGRKHGTFILHRKDGSIEQQLSYKDGALYGINTWYDVSGAVTAAAVYVGDAEHYPLTYCNGNK